MIIAINNNSYAYSSVLTPCPADSLAAPPPTALAVVSSSHDDKKDSSM